MRDGYPTMDQRFLGAFLTPRATRLCGYTLYPWCLKHRIWLTGLGHPLVMGSGPCSPAELIFFAKVCSETPDPSATTLRDRWQAVRLADPVRLAASLVVAHDHLRMEYWPRFWERKEEEGTSRNRGMPWALGIIMNLVRSGMSLEEALNLPECQAVWMSAGSSIQQGASLDFLTSEDEALLDELARVKATAPSPS